MSTKRDKEWFDRLWKTNAGHVRAYLQRRVQPSDVDDLLSEVFVVAWRHRNRKPNAELEMAADATIQCVIDAGGKASWDYGDSARDSIGWIIHGTDPELLTQCEDVHFRAVGRVWNQQNEPLPAEGFYFYASVVRCTEARTGNSYGELTQDQLGFMSTVGQRTINEAIAQARDVYLGCFDDVLSQPLHYYFVLECVTGVTGYEFLSFTDSGSERLAVDQIEILDDAREEFPDEFNHCMGEVALD